MAVEQSNQLGGRLGWTDSPGHDLPVFQPPAIERGVVIEILPQRGSFESQAGEQSLRSRPRKNVSLHLRVRLSGRRASHRARGDGAFRAQRELARKQFVRATLVHYQHDQVRLGSADLEADAAALNANRARRRPSLAALVPAGQVAFSILAAKYESRGLESRHNHDAVCVIEHLIGNALIRRCHNFREHRRGFDQPLCGFVVLGQQRRQSQRRKS